MIKDISVTITIENKNIKLSGSVDDLSILFNILKEYINIKDLTKDIEHLKDDCGSINKTGYYK